MFRKGFIIFLVLVMLSLAIPLLFAQADLVWEPENDFYNRNKSKCVSLSRGFYANGEDGYISMKREPGARREVAKLENGEILHILFTYDHNGEVWGLSEFISPKTYDWISGWGQMDQLLLVYDYISFDEDYSGEFFDYENDADKVAKTGDIVVWTWPGSGKIELVFEEEWQNPETYEFILGGSFRAYKDSEDRVWGYIGYAYGARNVWVCLSDPSNREIPAFNPAPEPVLRKAGDKVNSSSNDTKRDDTDHNNTNRDDKGLDDSEIDVEQIGDTLPILAIMPTIMVVSILVSAVALVTVVLVLLLKKKKR